MTALSVNLNKIAVLRNSRGGDLPCVQQAAQVCVAAGCQGITVHPRPDQRHIRPNDVYKLREWLPVELNIEGNPFSSTMPNGYPGFLALIERVKPAQCTLVPDDANQITSDHGFNLQHDAARLQPVIAQLKQWGCRVSLFMDAVFHTENNFDLQRNIEKAAEIGADRIEIYTGPYAQAFLNRLHQPEQFSHAIQNCLHIAQLAQSVGLGVNAGHDLDIQNLAYFLQYTPNILEVSIGHALIGEAIYAGLEQTVKTYSDICVNQAVT